MSNNKKSAKKVLKLVPNKPEESVVEMLQETLVEAHDGEIVGLGMILIRKGRFYNTQWTLPHGSNFADFILACDEMKLIVLQRIRELGDK